MRTVENIHGCRINQLDPSNFRLEFLASFEGSSHSVWVPSKNVAEDIRRKFSREWWALCREEKSPNFSALMEGSGEVLVKARDMKNRSPLHYACGIGNLTNVESLLANEAEVDAHVIFKTYYTIHSQFSLKQDCEGYTSLHIAAGYLNTETVEILLRAGADPEVEDDSGRSALNLVETLKAATPASTTTYTKRSRLETLSTLLRNYTFEEVVPSNIIDSRISDNGGVEYLVEWMDGNHFLFIQISF
jgi:signal recognition particle protein